MENRQQHTFSLRPGLCLVPIKLKFSSSGEVDGYGNTLPCADVVRVSGEEKHSVKYNWVKGLVPYGEWDSIAPVTLDGTGKYTIRFGDEFLGLTGWKYGIEDSSNTTHLSVILVSFTESDSDNDYRSSCVIQFVNTSGIAADPNEDSILHLEFAMKTSEQG